GHPLAGARAAGALGLRPGEPWGLGAGLLLSARRAAVCLRLSRIPADLGEHPPWAPVVCSLGACDRCAARLAGCPHPDAGWHCPECGRLARTGSRLVAALLCRLVWAASTCAVRPLVLAGA